MLANADYVISVGHSYLLKISVLSNPEYRDVYGLLYWFFVLNCEDKKLNLLFVEVLFDIKGFSITNTVFYFSSSIFYIEVYFFCWEIVKFGKSFF